MGAMVQVHDELAPGRRTRSFTLYLASERITVRELIRRRVEEEVEAYNRARPEVFQGLVQPTDAERVLNGYRLKTRRPLDAAAQVEHALRAFETNGFLIVVGDRQVEDLDESIAVTPATEISFVKLVPLVGG